MSIAVVTDRDSHKWKVLVNFIQQGPLLSCPRQANKTAKEIHDKHYPHATLQYAQEN